MGNLIELCIELMMTGISMVMKPFSLVKLLFLLGVRTICLATILWLQLVKGIIDFHVDLCWRIMVLAVAFVLLPVRVLTALQRERMLEMHLHEIQSHLESLVWENRELEDRLQLAMKGRKIIETVFVEIEEEHDKALTRIDLLENELQDLKEENLRLSEVHGKALSNYKARDDKGGISLGTNYGVSSWSSVYSGSGVILQDILMHGDPWVSADKGKSQQDILRAEPTAAGSYPFPPHAVPRNPLVEAALLRRRDVALLQSLFSAILSLLVGMIIWEAEDPCMPLVAALFTVVGMSLVSVIQFFSTINNKPASDAVALLSINWFILGTITYPSLPNVAHMFVPRIRIVADWLLIWIGFSA